MEKIPKGLSEFGVTKRQVIEFLQLYFSDTSKFTPGRVHETK